MAEEIFIMKKYKATFYTALLLIKEWSAAQMLIDAENNW